MKHSRKQALRPAVLALALAAAGTAVEVRDEGQRLELRNPRLAVVFDRSQGGMPISLTCSEGGAPLLSDLRLYTDFGLYPERGHVGTRNETEPEVSIVRGPGTVTVVSRGVLRGDPAAGHRLIPYAVTVQADDSATLHLTCELTPPVAQAETSAFLAVCFVIPAMSEWAVHTVDGILRQDVGDGRNRDYEAGRLWIHPETPRVGFLTGPGEGILVHDIRCENPRDLQNVIIHGKAFFLAWYAGAPVPIPGAAHRLSFAVTIGRGDPMRMPPQ
ncbi:MAG: hypothetical protein JXR77_18360 [Lentisphaeria bacterium]|nr:hypothetical protein [Lentisphaeria bacterium]